jgi:oligopeptide/dipeptide ABC transporter ATP-binding protein
MTAGQLENDPLHPYTKALLGAVPDMSHPRAEPLVSIPGQMPDVRSVPSGCAYHPRCAAAVERCSVERPPLLLHTDRHRVACWVANDDVSSQPVPAPVEAEQPGDAPVAPVTVQAGGLS